MTSSTLSDLYAHMYWADAEIWRAVLDSDHGADSDDRVLDVLFHLHDTQMSFLAVWSQTESVRRQRTDFDSLEHVLEWAHTFHCEAPLVLESWSESECRDEVDIPWAKHFERYMGGPAGPVTRSESAYQVVLHSMHHRGQVASRLRALGHTPPLMDYIAWLWRDRPSASWPATGNRNTDQSVI